MRAAAFGVLAFALLLAGCGGGPADPPPVDSIAARFGALSDVIVVSATDRLPLRSAVLVAPDGERVPAYSLDVTASPLVAPSLGEEALMAAPGTPQRVTRIDTMVSAALIRVPDTNRYAKTWPQSRIELRLGDPGSGERMVTLDAPKPPP